MKKELLTNVFAAFLAAFVLISCSKDDGGTTPESKLLEYNGIKLGAQNNAINGFLSLVDGKTYNITEAGNNAANINLLCYYEFTEEYPNEMCLASPGSNIKGIFLDTENTEIINSWSVKNITNFNQTTLTPEQFAKVTEPDSVSSYYNSSDNYKKAKVLKANDIYAFKTHDNKFGIFKVVLVSGTEDGYVEFDVKMQKY